MDKHVESYGIKLPIGFLSLICGIFINKKHDIVSIEDEIVVHLRLVSFSYKLFAGKHVLDIVLLNIPHLDEYDLTANINVLDVPPMFGPFIIHILKVLMQESKVLKLIIDVSSTRKGVVKKLIQMFNPKVVDASSSQAAA